jgi:hypothetical protein
MKGGVFLLEIPIGKDYVITSDPLSIILNEKRVVQEGENKGREYLTSIGFYNTMDGCLEDLLQLKIRKSEATSLKELINEIGEINKFIREQFRKARGKK